MKISFPGRLVFLCLGCLFAARAQPPVGRALLISDIHFDPLENKSAVKKLMASPPGEWAAILSAEVPSAPRGSDSNYRLFREVLGAAAGKGPYDYVIFQGDGLRHRFREALLAAGGTDDDLPLFSVNTERFVLRTLQETLQTSVVGAIGNNDSGCGDYRMDPGDSFLEALSAELPALSTSPDAKSSFLAGGYYSIPNPKVSHQDLIVLNSVLWSPKYRPCKSISGDPGWQELDWLATKLEAAKRNSRSTLLVMHIPPGADVNASLGKCAETPFWNSRYLTRFSEILQEFPGVVRIGFAGHSHRDDFRLVTTPNGSPQFPIRITSSVSPIYGNDPEFSVMSYDPKTGNVSDFTTYSLALSLPKPVWRAGSSFVKTYGIQTFDAEDVAALAARILARDSKLELAYEEHYAMGAPGAVTLGALRYYGCALTTLSEMDYQTCVCPSGR